MTLKSVKRKMNIKKTLLNTGLLIFSPTNKLIIRLSESLDNDVLMYQKIIYRSYKKHRKVTTRRKLIA